MDTNTTNLASLLVQVRHPTDLAIHLHHKTVSLDLKRLHPVPDLHSEMNTQALHRDPHLGIQDLPIILLVPIRVTQVPVNALNQVFQAKEHHLHHTQVKAHRALRIPAKVLRLHRSQDKDHRHQLILDRAHQRHHIRDKAQALVAYLANQDLTIRIKVRQVRIIQVNPANKEHLVNLVDSGLAITPKILELMKVVTILLFPENRTKTTQY